MLKYNPNVLAYPDDARRNTRLHLSRANYVRLNYRRPQHYKILLEELVAFAPRNPECPA